MWLIHIGMTKLILMFLVPLLSFRSQESHEHLPSCTTMSTLPASKLSAGLSYCRLAEVKECNAPAFLHSPNSNSSNVGSMTSMDMRVVCSKPARLRNSNIDWCFITRSPSYIHQRAHWVNAMKGEGDHKLKEKIVWGSLFHWVELSNPSNSAGDFPGVWPLYRLRWLSFESQM